jgi:glycosyltransferase involved in cell wall biosynthesis/peptidoglycan/xylan/chitin deacetylase (PgdA/CDA1 family)
MLLNKAYYLLKPLIPWRLRTLLRRNRAERLRVQFADVWPIDPRSAVAPPNWPGWPEGKKFAFVLSHDVEWTKGYERVEKLMAVEQKHGFRSSFNFVPERDYRVSKPLRDRLVREGFEIGVHGLYHDGKLYSSKAEFARRAARIREYAKEWGAVGFRSPLMQHNLSWLHDLEMEYDSSTFDTDPFEPEPDGFGTIFPFWVECPNGDGFVELPYTLPQDFGLFIVLREKTIDIWKKKVDWIAEHGGMALLNTHPDYLCFDGTPQADEVPISLYEELLTYVREKYSGQYWAALPREVAQHYRCSLPLTARNSRKRICMLAYSHYESDSRIRRYAETLVKRGDMVDVIALTGDEQPMGSADVHGVNVIHVQDRKGVERNKWEYAARLLRFLFTSAREITKRQKLVRYDLIHVHNMPDFLVFACWYPKLMGTKLILDIHDIVPELFGNRFGSGGDSLYIRCLKWIEKKSANFVDHLIISNDIWMKTIERSASPKKCSVYVNNVDPAVYYPHARTRTDDRFIIIFPGSFQWHQGLDLAVEAMAKIKDRAPHAELHLYGGGAMEASLRRQVKDLHLEGQVKFQGRCSAEAIVQLIADADMGIVPKRADSFGNEAYSTKIMEFMSQGVPAVISRTAVDTLYFDDSVVQFFTSGDVQAMADAMLEVIENPELRERLRKAGYAYAEKNGWGSRRQDYLDLIDSLCTEQVRPEKLKTEEIPAV